MALIDAIRSGVATAKTVLSGAGLLTTVTHYAATGKNAYGEPTYAAPVTRSALVEDVDKVFRRPDNTDVVASLSITFLEAVTVTGEDKIVLADGRWAPIVNIDRGVSPLSGGALAVTVFLGA